jgi:hypothetical protein
MGDFERKWAVDNITLRDDVPTSLASSWPFMPSASIWTSTPHLHAPVADRLFARSGVFGRGKLGNNPLVNPIRAATLASDVSGQEASPTVIGDSRSVQDQGHPTAFNSIAKKTSPLHLRSAMHGARQQCLRQWANGAPPKRRYAGARRVQAQHEGGGGEKRRDFFRRCCLCRAWS